MKASITVIRAILNKTRKLILINKKKNRFFVTFIWLSLLFPFSTKSQNLDQQTIQRLMSLPYEQQALIESQYGINIEDLSSISDTNDNSIRSLSEVGRRGSILERPTSMKPEILEKLENRISEFYILNENTPIFERDYESLMSLPLFGSYLFENEVSTYAPIDNLPVPNTYQLGAGDSISLFLYGNENISTTLPISREGNINFPRVGSISIAGLTFSEAKSLIEKRIMDQFIGTTVEVSMGDLKSINVIVAGEIKVPGLYSVSSLATVTQMLFTAGGISEIGSLRNIEIKRNGKKISSFDSYDILVNGDSSQDIRLQNGDTVLVNMLKNVAVIDGEVRRPGKYEFKDGDTIADLLHLSGGINNKAYSKKVTLERFNQLSQLPEIINVNLTKDNEKLIKLIDGDILRVASSSNRKNNVVTLKGAFVRPGNYGWYDGQRFSDVIDDIATDVSENADLSTALIIRRLDGNENKIKVLSFDPLIAKNKPNGDDDPVLSNMDEIIILEQASNFFMDQFSDEQNQRADDIKDNNEKDNEVEGQSGVDTEIPDNDTETSSLDAQAPAEIIFPLDNSSRKTIISEIVSKLKMQADNELLASVVSIDGAVKDPGDYPLAEGDNVYDLIKLAGGLKFDAYSEMAEIRRMNNSKGNKTEIEFLTVNLNNEIDANNPIKTILKERDHLRVNAIKDWALENTMEIIGEVNYPGTYMIKPGEKLSSVLKRAGGLTSESFPEGAILTRESVRIKEEEQLNSLANSIRKDIAAKTMTREVVEQSLDSGLTESAINAILEIEAIGRLIIDLPSIIRGNDSSDLVVMNGDSLTIPKYDDVITVVGQVRRPGSFVRQESLTINDYIDLAAGLTQRADKSAIYIIKPNGSIQNNIALREKLLEFNSINGEVMAGDTIVVPIKSTYQTPLNYYSTVTQAIIQSLTSIFAIDALLGGN